MKKRLVVLSGSGISAESGIRTFRDAGGLWENYPVMDVASHDGWLRNPALVTQFYNERRAQLLTAQPNRAHEILHELEDDFDVTIVTQNVDNLHERAGSSHVIHLHGELMKVTSSDDPDNPAYIRELSPDNCTVAPGTLAPDGSLLRPYIVFFQEGVPNMGIAGRAVMAADILVVVGTSLVVYPAASLVDYAAPSTPVFLVDPADIAISRPGVTHIKQTATIGMAQLASLLRRAEV